MDNSNKTYILVHGAWHGAWSWNKTKAELEKKGAKVICPDLPGHGEDKTEIREVTMSAYVEKVKEELEGLSESVILVGHSMSGFVISQIAEEMPEKVEKLVFVAAMIPYEGKTVFDILSNDPKSELLANLIFAEDESWATVSAEILKNVVYNEVPADIVSEAASKLVRQATQPFFVGADTSANAFGKVEKTYVVCEKDKILSPDTQRGLVEKARISRTLSINTGHVPQIQDPAGLAELLSIA